MGGLVRLIRFQACQEWYSAVDESSKHARKVPTESGGEVFRRRLTKTNWVTVRTRVIPSFRVWFRAILLCLILNCTKMNADFEYSLFTGGAHSRVEASISSPISPPYVAKQLTALFHTQPPFSSLGYESVAPYQRVGRLSM